LDKVFFTTSKNKNKDGAIDNRELIEILGIKLNEVDFKIWGELISGIDKNHDGKISIEEFFSMMYSKE